MDEITQGPMILAFVLLVGVLFVSIWFARHRNGDERMVQKKYNKDGSINQQWFAEEITRREGKLKEVDIGQIKEVLRVSIEILKEYYKEDPDKVQKLFSS